jgi:hypothetical protein
LEEAARRIDQPRATPQHHSSASESRDSDARTPLAVQEKVSSEPRPRWFPPVLIVTIAIASALVMVVAGAIGWTGGFATGVSRTSAATAGLEFVAELQEDPDATLSSQEEFSGPRGNDPSQDEDMRIPSRYFESLDEGTEVFTSTPVTDLGVDDTGMRRIVFPPNGLTCLHAIQADDARDSGAAPGGGATCGSPLVDMTLDLIVVAADDGGALHSNTIATDAFVPGTVVRLVYHARTMSISVWQLPPGA